MFAPEPSQVSGRSLYRLCRPDYNTLQMSCPVGAHTRTAWDNPHRSRSTVRIETKAQAKELTSFSHCQKVFTQRTPEFSSEKVVNSGIVCAHGFSSGAWHLRKQRRPRPTVVHSPGLISKRKFTYKSSRPPKNQNKMARCVGEIEFCAPNRLCATSWRQQLIHGFVIGLAVQIRPKVYRSFICYCAKKMLPQMAR